MKALDDEEYELLLRWLRGEFDTQCNNRTTKEKTALRKFYRWMKEHELKVGVSGRTVYIDGKRLLRSNEIETEIRRADKDTKSSGSRKVKSRLDSSVIGVAESQIIESRSKRVDLKVGIGIPFICHPSSVVVTGQSNPLDKNSYKD